jgi:hypothetical protein
MERGNRKMQRERDKKAGEKVRAECPSKDDTERGGGEKMLSDETKQRRRATWLVV